MSLPDTVFIFVLALIIFGPKKLPEIGRQLGKLVGEFRRASNEFKFQIEEELRQVDLNDKPSTRQTIAAPLDTAAAETSSYPALPEAVEDPAANLPVGQHPNIDTLNTAELNSPDMNPLGSNDSGVEAANTEPAPAAAAPTAMIPTITPAPGAEARTTVPYAATPVPADTPLEHLNVPIQPQTATENVSPLPEKPALENHHSVPVEAEIVHD